ncbi:hypothetical protein D3C80_1814190 [compost metagenome]
MLDPELMIMAIVPGPAVLGMASGTKAMLAEGFLRSSSDLVSTSGASSALCCGKSMRKPINATISPPAMRRPGMEMPKVFMTN